MDDSYILSKNKDFLHEMLTKITQIASDLGIFINHKKTRIMKINHFFHMVKVEV